MAFPTGAQTITVTGNFPVPVGGTARKGRVVFTPSARLVDDTQKAIYSGGGSITLDTDGEFTAVLLCTDDTDIQPAGWRWRVDEQPASGPRRTYWIALPSTLGASVDLSELAEVDAPDGSTGGGGGSGGAPTGPAGGALTGTYPNPQLAPATIASFDPAGAASAAQTAAATDATVKANVAQTAATSAAATDATAKVAAHTAATDPHGDRAAATAALSAHAVDTSDIHGIPDTSVLETQAGAQSKADSAQSAATSTAAADATTKVAAHASDTTDVHGIADTAALETQTGAQAKASAAQAAATTAAATDATSKVSAHTAASDPHGDRAYGDNKFATQLDLTTLNGTVNNLSTTVTAIDGYLNDALTRIEAIEQGTAFLAGGHFTGDVEVIDSELIVRTTFGDVGRLRPTPWLFNVTDPAYGAKGDAKVIADGAITAGAAILTSPSNGLAGATAGMYVSVKGAGPTGVTTHIAQIASVQNNGQVTLTVNAAVTVTGAIVIFGTDDTAAIQAAVTAAETYLAAGRGYAQVYFPPRPYIVAGPLNNTRSGNGQIVFGPVATTGNKKILEFRGEGDGAAAVRHWQQTVPQYAGSCLISFGVYSSTSAQISNINADGNPAVICGPNEGWGYGVAAAFSNMQVVVKNLAILTTHSSFGLTYGALNLYGVANAYVENVGYGTAGVVPGTDYTSPGVFGTGLSMGLLLPAPGNNDHVILRNVGCGGGYTYAMSLTEHTFADRVMALYSWAGLVVIGTYFGSVGSVHAIDVVSASVEACINELYIIGAGSSGVGPMVYANISTESSTPNVGGQVAHMAAARGLIRWTGLFSESGLAHDNPTGIESVNGQAVSPVRTVTGTVTARPIDRVLKADASSAGVTVNLPSAAPNPVVYTIVKVDATGNTVTIDPSGAQTINGAATRILSTQWESVTIRSDGANWIAV